MENSLEEETIKSSPNYDQQVDEIELLKNIIPEKVTILKEEPNFNIQIDIDPNDSDTDEPIKQFILIIYLNFDYPEKQPRFEISEINNNLSGERREYIENKLTQYCNENLGFPMIYQLYEMCQEFANEEEKNSKLEKMETQKDINPYQLNRLDKIKIINDIPIDIILLKNKNILIITKDNKIKIYDNMFESLSLETYNNDSFYPITFCKYFPSSSEKENDFLYLFTNKEVLVYELCYLFKKKIIEERNIKINGNISLNFISKIDSITDVIELPNFKNSVFFVEGYEKKFFLHKYDKAKNSDKRKTILSLSEKKYIKNKYEKVFRKLYKINQEKFIIASYTLKKKGEDQYVIEGINKMIFVDSNTFEMKRSYDIKISPLNHSISDYKNKYIIVSYFNTIDKKNKNKKNNNDSDDDDDDNTIKEEQYNFEDNKYNEIFYKVERNNRYDDYYYYDDYDYYDDYLENVRRERDNYITRTYESFDNKYYSYDIAEHYLGIFNIFNEELVTIIEFDPIKIMYNINDNMLCLFEKSKQNKKDEQITNERMFHHYFNGIDLDEAETAHNYEREKYIGFLLFDEGSKLYQNDIDYSNITSFIEVDKGYLAIGSLKKGIILYSK